MRPVNARSTAKRYCVIKILFACYGMISVRSCGATKTHCTTKIVLEKDTERKFGRPHITQPLVFKNDIRCGFKRNWFYDCFFNVCVDFFPPTTEQILFVRVLGFMLSNLSLPSFHFPVGEQWQVVWLKQVMFTFIPLPFGNSDVAAAPTAAISAGANAHPFNGNIPKTAITVIKCRDAILNPAASSRFFPRYMIHSTGFAISGMSILIVNAGIVIGPTVTVVCPTLSNACEIAPVISSTIGCAAFTAASAFRGSHAI